MSTVPANPTRITFRTSNNHEFEVDEAVVMELGTVKTFFDENPNASDGPIPLPNVSSKCLSTIIEYRKFHLALRARGDSLAVEDEAKAYDDELVKGHDNESLIELVLAVNFLNIKDMLDMLKQGIADRIENKRVEYGTTAQYEWAFEGLDPDQG
ncbi:Arabidopsis SKP-like 2 [Hibiscus trionum]|uniref:SKP1-like protein n=1 Tax=Hibiscus trionum TaxID=183268 RepID=A0A9W7I4A7_HIBTR|nr:Arabidopsis SKP-like 2 [Hibiscus trionum]